MILRLIFAAICSLMILGLMPYLNRARASSDKAIVSYRLHPFETKVDQPLLVEEKPAIVEKIAQTVTIETTIPKPVMNVAMPTINKIVSSELTFSAGAFVGSYASGHENSVIVAEAPEKLNVQPLLLQMDGNDHLLYGPKPITPLRARQQGINGSVMVQFEVNEKGLVENVKVLKSSDDLFVKAVVNAVKQYRFRPFTDDNGVPIRVSRAKEISFEIK